MEWGDLLFLVFGTYFAVSVVFAAMFYYISVSVPVVSTFITDLISFQRAEALPQRGGFISVPVVIVIVIGLSGHGGRL